MNALLTGLITGFVMCIPIGPINVWVVNTQIKENQAHALAIALGGSIMDYIYFYTILTGLTFVSFSQTTKTYLNIAGLLFVFILGVKEIFTERTIEKTEPKDISKHRFLGYVLVGALIYASNPTLIISMTGLATFIKSLGFFIFNIQNITILSIALALGSFSWFVFLTQLMKYLKNRFKMKHLNLMSKGSGYLMVIISVYLAITLYRQGTIL